MEFVYPVAGGTTGGNIVEESEDGDHQDREDILNELKTESSHDGNDNHTE